MQKVMVGDAELIDNWPSTGALARSVRREHRKQRNLSFRKGEVLNGTKRINTERVQQFKKRVRHAIGQ